MQTKNIPPAHHEKELLDVGFDVHADSISGAMAEGGDGEGRFYDKISRDLRAVDGLLSKLREGGKERRVGNESGPCGVALARHLRRQGLACQVAAPFP